MSIRIAVIVLMLGAALAGRVSAQDASVRVTARAEPMEAAVGETVVFTVQVEGAPATVVQTPERPATVNLDPQHRTPQTQRTHSTEGGTSRHSVTFSWRFRPPETGRARIRPVTVVVRGQEYTTDAVQVQVAPPSNSRSGPRLTHPDGAPSGRPLDERDLFVRASATTDRVYQNEQVVVEYRLFYRSGIRLRHSRLADSWNAPGFWREELNVASRPTPQQQRVDGRTYETVVLKRVALFPTRPGTLRVDPLRIETEAQGTMRLRRDGPALRGRFKPVQLASQRLSVRVQPLPPEAPASFDGAVGRFSMTARVDADSVSVGESVPLTVRMQGTGPLTTLSQPSLDLPPAIEAYEPTVETDIERNGRRIHGTKTFTYTLVPRSGGRHVLPSIPFSYFDPEAERYVTLRAEVSSLHVSGTAAREAVGRTGDGLPVGDVTDLMSADEAHWGRTDRRPLYRQPWTYLALLLPVLLAGGGIAYRRWGRTQGSASSRPSEAPLDAAHTELHAARRRLEEGADAAVYDTVEQSLRTVLDERMGRDGAATTRTTLDRRLAHHDVPEALRNRLYELLDRCNEAQYAPGTATHSALEDVLDDAHTLLRWLDEHLPPPERPLDPS